MSYCKHVLIFCFTFFTTINVLSQTASEEDLTGLWTGLMYNDTTALNYRYEVAISGKKGKLVGYSHTFFLLDGIEYYGVKKLKISIDGNKVITQDLKLVDNNYPIKPPKGVYMMNVLVFERNNNDLILSGMFSTNRTRAYAPATGYIHIERKTEFRNSSLVPHLEGLGLADELSFVQEEKEKQASMAAVAPQKTNLPVKTKEPETEKNAETTVVKIRETKPAEQAKEVEKKTKADLTKNTPNEKPKPAETINTTNEKPKLEISAKASVSVPRPVKNAGAEIKERMIETIQSVNYSSDSLVLTLYDNGEVDGDTVSVLLNGEVIMPLIGLSTNAVRKVIYTKDLPETVQIVMYAETLGSLPPNTGLLIVNDGKDRYEIRFSGDLKKNAAIEFKRKER